MSLYENVSCPVCKRAFEKDDIIVTCPECGTPHHRECYDLIGRCVNAGLHKSGYDFFGEEANKTADANDYYYTDNKEDTEAEKEVNGNESTFVPPVFMPVIASGYENDSDTIDGESVADFAAVIRTNISGFIKKFKRLEKSKSALSWNWGGFLFGSLYMLFRKMYKQGIAFFCVFLSVIYGSYAMIAKYAPVFYKNMTDLVLSGEKNITMEQAESVMHSSDAMTASKIGYIMFAVMLVIRIIIALVTDRIYKNTVSAIIKKVKEQLENGATFIQTPMMSNQDINLNQTQMRRMYLSKRGGVSLFAPLMAMLIISFFL